MAVFTYLAVAVVLAPSALSQTARLGGRVGLSERQALARFERDGTPPITFAHVVNGRWSTQHRGLTVLNFWATWCAPCIKEFPLLETFSKRHDPSVLRVVGFTRFYGRSVDEELRKIDEALKRNRVTYASLVEVDGKTHDAFYAQGLPTTVLIDAEGKVVAWGRGEPGAKRIMQLADQLVGKR